VFVEIVGRVLVVLAHVDLELLSGATALPAIITVSQAIDSISNCSKHGSAPPCKAIPEITGCQSQQKHKVVKGKMALEEICSFHRPDENDDVLDRYGYGNKHQHDRGIAVEQIKHHQDSVGSGSGSQCAALSYYPSKRKHKPQYPCGNQGAKIKL